MDERTLLARSGGPVTRRRLARDLTTLGLGPGDTVMFHTRMSALGYVAGGAGTVLDALLDVVGASGTLMVTCGWNDALPYDFDTWPAAWRDAVRDEHPAFDPESSECDHANGRLPEALRHRPGALRSRHPDASFAALGAGARELTVDQPWDDPHGPDSPLARLVARGGRVLMLGAPLDTLTLLHHAEALAEAPGKRFVSYEQPVRDGGRRVWRRFHDIDSERGAFDYGSAVPPGRDPFEVIGADLLAAGLGRSGRVGAARCHLLDAGTVVEFGRAWIEERLGGAS
ncbi:aminoglycoside 3-N-acetyltransferase [Streptomyces sp. NPDC050145]|uniref:aminoglycoside 3-N-acetyltransferase n=1 Tax=Streptomyces sp. NPDC050145 TaxID=3365602 RepID=UPI0037A802D1